MEIATFFKNGKHSLFGIIHTPENPPPQSEKIGIVFCHPFAEEKLISHRVLVNMSRYLTKEGIYCLRFDYMGHGDSSGNFEDATISTRISDIQTAIAYLKSQTGVEKVGLLGLRLGAALAALSADDTFFSNPLVLISPIIKGKTYIRQCLRSNLATQMAVYNKIDQDRKALVNELMNGNKINIDGYLLTKRMYEQFLAVNLFNTPVNSKNILIVEISKKATKPIDKNIEELCMKYKESKLHVEFINIMDDYFWTDTNIYNPTKHKLQKNILDFLHKINL